MSATSPSSEANADPSTSLTASEQATYYETGTAIHDLGRDRFDHDVAAIGDRDTSFFARAPVIVAKGRAPRGMEAQVFAWNTMQYTTEDKDEKEEMKGDLHGGQLHRQNRAATTAMMGGGDDGGMGRGIMRGGIRGGMRGGMRGTGGRNGRGGRAGMGHEQPETHLVAAMKPEHDAPPLAKGFAEELTADMFWSEPIV